MLGKQLPAFYGAPQGTLEKKTEVLLRDPEKEFFPCIYLCLVVNEFNQNQHMSCDECVPLHQELSTDPFYSYSNTFWPSEKQWAAGDEPLITYKCALAALQNMVLRMIV